jgi:UDP-N-acetylmuramoyl-tripeptide--D-alanyl-D-alanine ligase
LTQPLWTYSDLVAATRGRLVGTPARAITGLSIDSRTVGAGDAFLAIKGDAFDGHDFAAAAIEKGAAIAIVAEEKLASLPNGEPYLVVPDVLDAMTAMGLAARARSKARVVAVTGSVGKTGTKEALRLALSTNGETHASVASFNNHWGVPLTLARMAATARYGVFEIGMNHAGEITPLTRMVRPHVTVITTVEPVHLEFFPNVEGIAEAKAEIFLGLEPGGAAVVNVDNPYTPILLKRAAERGARIVTFGTAAGADVRLVSATIGEDGSFVVADLMGSPVHYRLGAPGRHVVQNSLAVVAAVALLGADVPKALAALEELAPPKGRGERHPLHLPGGAYTLVDESYNANPASMRAAIALLGGTPATRRIAVLGDMRELGETSDALHAALAEPIEAAGIDLVFLCGPHMEALWRALPETRRGAYAATASELQAVVESAVEPGDVVMVKGSLGTKMGPIVARLKSAHAAPDARKG